ncbi:MAG: HEAT repeat domain-containing protein [Acidobacteriota bacterium]
MLVPMKMSTGALSSPLANRWLKDFCLALKNLVLFTAEHPREGRTEVCFSRSGDRLYLEKVLLEQDFDLARQLAQDLERHGVDNIVFPAGATSQDLLLLLRRLLDDCKREPWGLDSVIRVNERFEESPPAQSPVDHRLVAQMVQIGRGTPPPAGVTSVLCGDPAAVGHAIENAVRERDPDRLRDASVLAEVTADTLERMADLAYEEHEKSREEIHAAIGRAVVGSDPAIHYLLMMEKGGPRSIRKNLIAAVEGLRPEQIADLVVIHRERARGDFRQLTAMLNRTTRWRRDRELMMSVLEPKLRAEGLGVEQTRDLLDSLIWSELPVARRLELLEKGNGLWRTDFSQVRETLMKLLSTGKTTQAEGLILKYLEGLSSESVSIRGRTAASIRKVLQLIEKTTRCRPAASRIGHVLFERFQEEKNEEIATRLAGGLAFLIDLLLRCDHMPMALDLMRKLDSIDNPFLEEALGRVGSEGTFKRLCERVLKSGGRIGQDAAEILKRCGSRTASFLIESLAEEEDRSRRSRLVGLLKEMGRATPAPFLARLDDQRWYLVRNVVGILGDIGDAEILPELDRVAAHPEPRVRREVVRTYRRLATPECLERIIKALDDNDRSVQLAAVKALASLGGEKAGRVLEKVARKRKPFTRVGAEVRQEALLSLGRLGAPGAYEVMYEILTRRRLLGLSEPADMRAAAARALGRLGTPRALTLLTEMARKDPRQVVRETASEALRKRTGTAVKR